MSIDIKAATSFLAAHGRLLDRRRLAVLLGEGDAAGVLAALDGYRNPDGGYGWGLEPDLRAPESQPGGALHAFEAMIDAAPATSPHAAALCDWLARATLSDGGLPFALPIADPTGTAPFWATADPTVAALQSTAFMAGVAHRLAKHDPAVAAHPWLATATRYCFDAIAATTAPHAIELAFAVRFLDTVHDTHAEAPALLDHLAQFLPDDGVVPVAGGSEGEALRPLDFAPEPGTPARRLFTADAVEDDLRRLATGQDTDGGWHVDFASFSPVAALEWRGYKTVSAVSVLRLNRLP